MKPLTTNDVLASALRQAKLLGSRTVSFTEGGVLLRTQDGTEHRLLHGDEPFLPDVADLREHLSAGRYSSSYGHPEDEIDLRGYGAFSMTAEPDGGLQLSSRKPPRALISSLVGMGDVELLRSCMRVENAAIHIIAPNRSRIDGMAYAVTAERALLGLSTTIDPSFLEKQTGWGVFDRGDAEALRAELSTEGPLSIEYRRYIRKHEPDGARILFSEGNHSYFGRHLDGGGGAGGTIASTYGDRPAAIALIELTDEGPALRVAVGEAMKRAIAALPDDLPRPWAELEAKRNGAKRPSTKPKTWHSRKEGVAKAFFEGKAPRGYTGGQPIYFHGPVCWAVFDGNPVAAIVDSSEGRVLLTGRSPRVGGSLAGTVSTTLGDILDANKRGPDLPVLALGDLSDIVRWGGGGLKHLPPRMLRAKNEHEYPSTAEIDAASFDVWFADRAAALRLEEADAFRTKFATGRQVASLAAQIRHAELGERVSSVLGREHIPTLDVADLADRRDRAQAAVEVREAGLAEKRHAKAAAAKADDRGAGVSPPSP